MQNEEKSLYNLEMDIVTAAVKYIKAVTSYEISRKASVSYEPQTEQFQVTIDSDHIVDFSELKDTVDAYEVRLHEVSNRSNASIVRAAFDVESDDLSQLYMEARGLMRSIRQEDWISSLRSLLHTYGVDYLNAVPEHKLKGFVADLKLLKKQYGEKEKKGD